MIRRSVALAIYTLGILLLGSVLLLAQQPVTGLPPLGSFSGGPFDSVDLANLNVHFSIPVFSKAGKGIPVDYALTYDSLMWEPVKSGSTTSWRPVSGWGWRTATEAATGWVNYSSEDSEDCFDSKGGFLYHDPSGGVHPFPLAVTIFYGSGVSGCSGQYRVVNITNQPAYDGSGYILTTAGNGYTITATINASGGLIIQVPAVNQSLGSGSVTDANGNKVQIAYNGTTQVTTITDTLNPTVPVLTVSGAENTQNPVTYTYTAPSGGNASVTVTYRLYYVATCFKVSNINEFLAAGEYLVDTIALPDSSSYHFTYETTVGCGANGYVVTGRIASVTLPTGGTISYSYAGTGCGNNSNCMMADGSPSAMTDKLELGPQVWTYQRNLNANGGGNQQYTQTSVEDYAGNWTYLNFNGIYETQRMVYQGSSTILRTLRTCYNGVYSGCDTSSSITAPITQKDANDYLNSTGYGTHSWRDYRYNGYGLVTQETDYGYSATTGPVLRTVNIGYNTSLCSSNNICDHPSSVQVLDGSANQKALTNYSYDANGNTHEISRWVSGSNYLNSIYIYNSGGTLATARDPNGTVTTYNYNGACNSAFPTSVQVPSSFTGGNLTTSYTYNCTGGVVTSVTDPNNAITSIGYTRDPYFWRPESTTDPLNNVTQYNYYKVPPSGTNAVNVGQVESVMNFNGSTSTSDILSTPEYYGRPYLQQQREGPGSGNWDTVQYVYDGANRTGWIYQPFVSTAGTGGSGVPETTYTFDALGRPTLVTDPGGGTTSYSYPLNDVQVTIGLAPTNSRQLEYDALGRVSSVCELLPSGGGSACNQNNNPGTNGYNTSYSYDALGNLTAVNQSGQARSFTYDGLSRMLSQTNPETSSNGTGGTINYYYDSDSTCSLSEPGNLLRRTDPAGYNTCYGWDGLHRIVSIGYPNSTGNPIKWFYYDKTYGFSEPHPAGRLVVTQVYLQTTAQYVAQEHFGYDARGEATDFFEWTQNSGNWYHTVNQYAPNGAVWGRFGYHGTGTDSPFTNGLGYVLDGEGRLNGLYDQTAAIPVWSGTTYNVMSQPDKVAFYSGDSESFTWDSATGRMKVWDSTVGSEQQTGTLTWNANGTLGQMQINDTANSANGQTCTYGYDDLARVASATCPTRWVQNFTYDAFGNITKSGSGIFNQGYGSGNHVSGFSYDANGDVTYDGANHYTYNAEGRATVVGSTTTIFDAFDRAVELQTGSGNTQIVYAPDGFKFAYMNGQTVRKYIAPLGAGTQAVYTAATPATPAYYRHADWLGTVRLDTTPSQTVYFDGAWAPFGEPYSGTGNSDRVFTGQTADTTAGTYDFLLRQYVATQGRWQVPDPAGLAAVDITNPQTWNRYAYVANNPLNAIDPKGLYCAIGANGGTFNGCMPSGGSYDAFAGTGPGGVYSFGSGGGLLGNIEASQEAFGDQLQAQFELTAAVDLADSILNQDDNGCSSWLNGYAADFMPPGLQGDILQNKAAAMFQSDSFALVNNSSFTQMTAYTYQGTGWGSSIYVNVNSPWTVSSPPPGMPGAGSGRYYTSGGFSGSDFASTSLYGQTVTVLHEFGHTINALGTDQGPNAQTTSSANTATVARNCGAAIHSAGK